MSRRSRPAIACFVYQLIAAGFLASIIVVLFSGWWVFDLFSHFRVQYVLTGFLIVPFLLWLRKYWVAGVVAMALLFHSVALWPYLQGSRVIAGPELPTHITVLFANIYYEDPDFDKITQLVQRTSPDVIILAEVPKKDYEKLASLLQTEYPVSYFEEGKGAYDMSFFSKTEPSAFQVLSFSDENPSMFAQFEQEGHFINIIGIHPHSPIASEDTRARDQHLKASLAYAAHLTDPTVVVGDFNISQFSPKFQRMLKDYGMIDTQLEFGLQPSWNADLLPLFRIPIDQVVVTENVEVYDRYIGEPTGSDHLPVIVKVGAKE